MTFNVLEDISIETPEGLVTLNQGQIIKLTKDEAIPLIEVGIITPDEKVAYRIYSEILQAYLWLADTDEDMHSLRSQGISEAIYTRREITELKKLPKEDLKDIHKVKEVFEDSTVEQVNKGQELTNEPNGRG